MITQATMRTILKTIFNVDEKWVVPKQGNWFNPQDKFDSGTWIAFLMRTNSPRVTPFDQQGAAPVAGVGSQISTSYIISDVELQIVGSDAEILAASVPHWLNRNDINVLFDSYHAQLCYEGLGDCAISNFAQDGLNGVLAYNVKFKVQWANMFESNQNQLLTSTITGNLTIGA